MKTHIQEKAALLLISDSVAMLFSFVIAILLGHKANFTLGLLYTHRWGFAALFVPTLLLFFVLDGYALHKVRQRFGQQALILGCGLLVSAILSTFIFFFFRDPVPRAVFLIFYASAFALVVYFRKVLNQRMLTSTQWRTLIVGDGIRSLEVAQFINSSAYLRTEVVGYVSGGNGSLAQGKLPRLGNIDDLVSVARKEAVDQVIVAVPSRDDDLIRLLLECMQSKIKVSEFRRVIEEITGRVPIDYLNDNWFLLELSCSNKRYFWYTKRLADIAASCIGLCLALPLFPFVALLIKVDSRGPVFYSQQRMGRGSKPFRVWKLRTMVDGADHNNVHWTTDHDDRITRVGRFIRKTRLDEVPQLLNIFKGEMSLIGPRPEALSLVEMYTKEIAYYSERHMVTPGITGWAQINYPYGNSIKDTRQKLMYDFYYIKNRSIVLDLMIFLRTIRIVLTGKGAM
ncbi:MAG: sugar transferase [Desulfocapsaceae bacterium]|nr:sugar transferase [Desulfocapsaceae bacterium]